MILYVSLATWPQALTMVSPGSIAYSICQEIEGHKKISQADGGNAVSGQLATHIINMLKHLKALSNDDASRMIKTLNTECPYEAEDNKRIRAIIDAKLQALKGHWMKGGYQIRQTLPEPENIFLSKEVAVLKDPKQSLSSKFALTVERLNLVGCCFPEEHTLKRCLAMIFLMHYPELPMARERHEEIQDLKVAVVTERKAYPFELDTMLPDKMEHLTPSKYNYAYGDEIQEIQVFLAINLVANKIAIKTNKQNKISIKHDPHHDK